jgi:serine/threonine protein kinase
MPAAASPQLAENYLRFAAKIGVIRNADIERELPNLRGMETKEIGKALVERGILHPNNFKLLESMFARQLSRMMQPTRKSVEETPPAKPPEAREPPPAVKVSTGFGLVKGDTTKLKGSAQATTRYRIVRPLATTGLSELFVAEDVELHREVVLKRLHAKHQTSPGYRVRFNRTAEVASGLEHPCIPPIYNHGLDADGRPYYTTRLLTGESLAESVSRLHAADPADPPRAIETKSPSDALRKYVQRLLQVCNALSYAHSRGVMHRGLSPDRILLGKHGETLVVGWGRAELIYSRRAKSSQAGAPAPSKGVENGLGASRPPKEASRSQFESPHAYTSPEQLKTDPSAVGILSDVYSLGAILFFAATGKPPFTAPSEDLPAAISEGLKPDSLALVEAVSPSVAKICSEAMSLDPTRRHASIRAFAAELELWLSESAISKSTAAPLPPPKEVAFDWSPRHLALAVGGVCLLSGLIGAWLGSSGRATGSPDPTTATSQVAAPMETPISTSDAVSQWINLLAAAATATPDAVDSIANASRILPHRKPETAAALLDAAEAALARRDDVEAARKLKEAEPLIIATSDPAAARPARLRWATAVGTLAERSKSSTDSIKLLQSAIAASDRRLRAEDDSWSGSKRSLSERLARLHAKEGRFREALRIGEDLKIPFDSTIDESSFRFLIERAEWLGFVDRHADAVAEFSRIADSFVGASSPRTAVRSQLRFRAQLGLAEQLLALDQSPKQAIDDAKRTSKSITDDSAETKALHARLKTLVGVSLFKSGSPKEADVTLKTATEMWSKATSGKDVAASELLGAAAVWDAFHVAVGVKNKEDALAAAERSLAFLERVPDRESVTERLNAVDIHRGVLLVQLGKLTEADTAYSRAVVRGGTAMVNALYLRAACRLELKNYFGARNDAEQLARRSEDSSRYLAARVFSRLAGVAEGRTKTAVQEDGGRAMSLLKELLGRRFFTGDRTDLPTNDAELESVRQREDFKALFAAKPASTEKASPPRERNPSSP